MRGLVIAAGALLVLLTTAAARDRVTTVRYTPPAQVGDIFTVIDFARGGGTEQPLLVREIMGNRRRIINAGTPYERCAQTTPAGVVVRFRHFSADSVPMTLSTTGVIVRGPYQGELPPEALHSCYNLVS